MVDLMPNASTANKHNQRFVYPRLSKLIYDELVKRTKILIHELTIVEDNGQWRIRNSF